MTLKSLKEDGGWLTIGYAATWDYGYDFMLDAARVLLEDFGDDLQRFGKAKIAGEKTVAVTDEVMECGGQLRKCAALGEECGVISVAGISRVMECPMQLTFYNQTNAVMLDIPIAQMPESHPARQRFDQRASGFEHTFDCYMDSVEIKAYCADTERRTVERLEKNKE